MIAPGHGQRDTAEVQGKVRKNHTWRRIIGRVIFAGTAIAMAYLTLMPNYGRSRFRLVPMPLYHWLTAPEHDWLMNIVAFGFLAMVVFIVGGNSGASCDRCSVSVFARRAGRLVVLLALVCAIEIAQIWIPGRTSSLEDVCFGWSGIFAAWLITVLWDVRAENRARK